MISNERNEKQENIWHVPRKEPMKRFSILTSPGLTFSNKEQWYAERKREQLEKIKQENKIF